ncbi:MAG TPA: hypothetical protein DCQ04_09965 [Actinobacteria bacterium]|nr:hypothetical protein [Actinomycetota bacterium]
MTGSGPVKGDLVKPTVSDTSHGPHEPEFDVELYQPLFGRHDQPVALRHTEDRADLIRTKLGSGLSDQHVVDLGCNLGYITLHLAQFARSAIGIDRDARNIRACRQIASEAGLKATFASEQVTPGIVGKLNKMNTGPKVFLMLNIVHHLVVAESLAFAQDTIREALQDNSLLILELARREEVVPQSWGWDRLPQHELQVLPPDILDCARIRILGWTSTHIPPYTRPMYMVQLSAPPLD